MVTERAEDLDCFALAEDELEAAVQVFYVRRGRVVGRKGFIVDKVEDLTPAQLLADVLEQHYADAVNGVPPLVLVPGEVDELDVIEEWLSGLRAEAVFRAQPAQPCGRDRSGRDRRRATRPKPSRRTRRTRRTRRDGRRTRRNTANRGRGQFGRERRCPGPGGQLERVVGGQRAAPARAQRQPEIGRDEPRPPPRAPPG